MNIKVDFDNIVVKEDKNDFNVKVLMLKGEKGDQGDGEPNVIDKIQVNGTDLPVTNKTVNVPVPTVDSTLSSSSINPVQNNAIYNALSNKVDASALNNYYEISEIDDLLNDKANILIVDKKPYYFDNIASMKAYDLQEGDYVITKGYYSANDGGCGEYVIVDDNTLVDNGGSIHTLNNGLRAKLIIKNLYVNVKQFGIKETETGDISTKLQNIITFLNDKGLIPFISILNIDTTLIIPMSSKIKINKINYTGNGYAISLSQGINGNIEIENIYSLTGSGVHINPTGDYSGNGYYKFNKIAVNGHSVYFDNDSVIVNSTFEGVQWYSRLEDCFVIKPLANSVVGQCNFKVNNYYAVDHVGVVIDTTYGSITNLDFGYSSVEGSTNGILINLVNFTEGIKGFFRVSEVASHQNNLYVLKIKGEASDIRNQIDLTFDSFRYDKIDVSELTMNAYASRGTPNILIEGKCFNGVGESLGYSGRIMDNRLCMDYINASNPYNLTADIDLNYETSNSTPRISSNFTTSGLTQDITVTLPKSLKPGVISSIKNTTGHTVTIKPYGNVTSSGIDFGTSGLFTTVIDGNGKLQIIKLL